MQKTINSINFILILCSCLLISLIETANRVGGFTVLAENLSPYNLGSILGGWIGTLLYSIVLAIIFNFILNLVKKMQGKEKKYMHIPITKFGPSYLSFLYCN